MFLFCFCFFWKIPNLRRETADNVTIPCPKHIAVLSCHVLQAKNCRLQKTSKSVICTQVLGNRNRAARACQSCTGHVPGTFLSSLKPNRLQPCDFLHWSLCRAQKGRTTQENMATANKTNVHFSGVPSVRRGGGQNACWRAGVAQLVESATFKLTVSDPCEVFSRSRQIMLTVMVLA